MWDSVVTLYEYLIPIAALLAICYGLLCFKGWSEKRKQMTKLRATGMSEEMCEKQCEQDKWDRAWQRQKGEQL